MARAAGWGAAAARPSPPPWTGGKLVGPEKMASGRGECAGGVGPAGGAGSGAGLGVGLHARVHMGLCVHIRA